MNNDRRSALKAVYADLKALNRRLRDILDEEEDALAQLPENLQFSSRAATMEDCIQSMHNASDAMQDAMNDIEEAAA